MSCTIITGEPEAVYHARDEVSNSSLAAIWTQKQLSDALEAAK